MLKYEIQVRERGSDEWSFTWRSLKNFSLDEARQAYYEICRERLNCEIRLVSVTEGIPFEVLAYRKARSNVD